MDLENCVFLKNGFNSVRDTHFVITVCECIWVGLLCLGTAPCFSLWSCAPAEGCLGILSAFPVTSVSKTQMTKVIAFKALFTIEFPVEKQYPRSIIDFLPSSICTLSRLTNQLQF